MVSRSGLGLSDYNGLPKMRGMQKTKTIFFCRECGYESAKWLGQCPGCRAWDTLVGEPVAKKVALVKSGTGLKSSPVPIAEVSLDTETRTTTGICEFDRVLGGGIVVGSLVLVGGDPGIGKSTLLLQVCRELSVRKKTLYISGEESLRQIKMRAERLGTFGSELLLLSETNLDTIEEIVSQLKPEIMVVDSIQTMYREDIAAAPGSVSQVRESTSALMRLAKESGITIFIVGHVTKEGQVAGPRVLEHMVDTVLYFEGEHSANYRILRAVKNRFGSTNEIGVFEMRAEGLTEVLNPSEYMLQGKPEGEPGSVVAAVLEGTRTILVEVQALVCKTSFQIPRRTAAGTDYNRMNLLMAVMEKRLGVELSWCDAYINVAGGLKVNEPAIDLGLVMALLSSFRNEPLDAKTVCFGEVGLTGEIRAVTMAEQRIREAAKMGYTVCILPEVQAKEIRQDNRIRLVGVKTVRDLAAILNGK